jgi:GT2 family glycosyltransferase
MPQADTPSLSVVIVSYGARGQLQRCLEALPVESDHVIVVDNASPDGSADLVRERFPHVYLLALAENRGFAAGANAGIAAARTPFVLLLNPDVRPLGQAVDQLLTCAEEHEGAAVVVPALVDERGRRQPSLVGYPSAWWTGRPPITTGRRWLPPRPEPGEAFAVGAAMLLRRDALEQVGGFDEAFFLFFEEVDLCRRLLDAGWGIRRCERSRFVHVGGVSARRDWSGAYRAQLQGYLRYLAKHRDEGVAERSRRRLAVAVRTRALLARGADRQAFVEGAAWLRSGDAAELLADRV